MKTRGFTIIELVCVVVILSIVTSVLLPVVAKARIDSKAQSAKSNLRKLWNGMLVYQSNYDEKVQYGLPQDMGLPPEASNFASFIEDFTGDHHNSWSTKQSILPCGKNVGEFDFDGLGYMPLVKDDWPSAVESLKAKTTLIYDKNCNVPETRVMCQFCEKRSIGITLDGILNDKINSNFMVYDQHFYQ